MANLDLDRDQRGTQSRRANANGSAPAKVLAVTEARRAFTTTEFWISVAMAATLVIAGYVSDAFAVDKAWALAAGVIAAYALSRGFAKAGSGETEIRNLDEYATH